MTRRTIAALLVGALLLAGCAKVPTSGPVEAGRGGRPEGVRGQEPIQVFAQRPQAGWTPAQVVSGFLAAMATPSDGDEVARAYLTPDVRAGWPAAKDPAVRVYAQDDDFRLEVGRDDTVTITATERATVSNSGEYQPSPEGTTMEAVFRMQRVNGQWRIGSLPNTKMMSAYDAVSAYSPFDAYFFAKESNVLVPSPIVLPAADRDDWPTDLTRALINGPQGSVAPGVASAIPSDTVLESSPTIDDNGRLTVQLGGGAVGLTGARRARMIAQLTATLLRIEGVSEVDVEIDGDNAVYGSSAFSAYEPARVVTAKRGYFINDDNELVAVDASAADVEPLAGPFGTGALTFVKPAISLDGRRAAALSVNGDDLWVGALNEKGKPTQLYNGKELSAPSWDRNGNLWVVENAESGPRLLRFTDGRGEPVEVEAEGLEGLHVSSVRVSWDGVRIAFAVGSGDAGELRTAVLDRDGDGGISVRNVRPVAPSLTAVDDVWWYDGRTLAVAAREQSDLRASYLVSVDGLSLRKASSVRDLDAVAAGTGLPLLVTDHDGRVAISQPDEFSSTTVGSGHSPAYPG
ncbi:MAG: hypothetical protein GEV07_13570 [Streptosporangiales bacterium]|nr:hypothetical protein [Streptosporangiales bacterium]